MLETSAGQFGIVLVHPFLIRSWASATPHAHCLSCECSCEQSVEMCPHGSPSAEAIADDPANSSDSSPARALTCNQTSTYKSAGQVSIMDLVFSTARGTTMSKADLLRLQQHNSWPLL